MAKTVIKGPNRGIEPDKAIFNKVRFLVEQPRTSTSAILNAQNSMLETVQALRTKYKNQPETLLEEEWARLEGNLDMLDNCSFVEKNRFHRLKKKYLSLLEVHSKKDIEDESKVDPVDYLKLFLRDAMNSCWSMELIYHRILDTKNRLTMSEEDLRQCISIIKKWIRDLHYINDGWYQELVRMFETDLALRLWSRFNDTKEPLTQSEWNFLADYVADYDDNLKIGEAILRKFMTQKDRQDLPTQETNDTEQETIFQSKIERLFSKTAKIQQKIIKLWTTPGYKIPEESYKPEKTAGFANLSIDGKDEIRQLGDGPILSKEDPLYGTNAPKYSRHATQKVFQLFTHPEEYYSENTPIKIPGGITFNFQGKVVSYAYSGGTPLQDQAIVIIGAHDAGRMSNEEFAQKQVTLNNPYLTAEFLKDLNDIV